MTAPEKEVYRRLRLAMSRHMLHIAKDQIKSAGNKLGGLTESDMPRAQWIEISNELDSIDQQITAIQGALKKLEGLD